MFIMISYSVANGSGRDGGADQSQYSAQAHHQPKGIYKSLVYGRFNLRP
jgi:hypothetical protein